MLKILIWSHFKASKVKSAVVTKAILLTGMRVMKRLKKASFAAVAICFEMIEVMR